MAQEAPSREQVRRFLEQGRTVVESLLAENERLRQAIAQAQKAPGGGEVEGLKAKALAISADASEARSRLEALQQDLARVEHENRELADQCVCLEARQAALSSIAAASTELHQSLDLKEVLTSLFEIVINLLGSESFAVYVVDEARGELRVAVEAGLPPLAPRAQGQREGVVGQALAGAEAYVETGPGRAEGEPLVVIPLRVREKAVGALAIFGFVAHKKGITALDRELFTLVSEQAATALYSAQLYARESRRAQTYQGLAGLMRKTAG